MDGDKVLILRQTTLNHSGEIGAIMYEDYATLKKVEYVNGEDWLKMIPVNPQYPPKRIESSELEECRVLGIPKLLIKEIDE
jgi:repressor LexA